MELAKEIVGISSAVIALCALAITIWQVYTMQKHNKLSVTPHLTIWTHSDMVKNIYSVQLLNNGIGPALINSFQVQVDNKAVIGEGAEPIERALKILFPQYTYASSQSFVSKGYMMSAKEVRNLVIVQFEGTQLTLPEEIEHAKKRARLLIEYESIYKDKSTLDTSFQG